MNSRKSFDSRKWNPPFVLLNFDNLFFALKTLYNATSGRVFEFRHENKKMRLKMILWSRCSILAFVSCFLTLILVANVYFVYTILEERSSGQEHSKRKMTTVKQHFQHKENSLKNQVLSKLRQKEKSGKFFPASGKNQLIATINASKKIRKTAVEIMAFYENNSEKHKFIVKKVLNELKEMVNVSLNMWDIAEKWVTGVQVLPDNAPLLGSILNSLCSTKIIRADNTKKGTQLKVLLTLEGGQQALFKPQWYSRTEIIRGPVYAGKDRHNAEVAAFHLSLLLNLRRVPLTVGRKVNLRREVMPVASPELLNTFYQEKNNTCFYGVCLYCEPNSPVCAEQDIIEGALIMWLPFSIRFQKYPNPWQRSYKKNLVARWEVEENYCQKIKHYELYEVKSRSRLLDLIDAVVFDFLMDNGDRHHYEVPVGLNPSSVFLFDNGKGFGNPNVDHLDILAPLYQCCIIRRKTWERMKIFAGGFLGPSLAETMKYSHISPVLAKSHLDALDRRLLLIFSAVEICMKENGASKVLL